jgi:phosphoadenosine phosphosulfate reductase
MPLKEFAYQQNLRHQKSPAEEILKQVLTDVRFGETALVSAFGSESVVLLHMVAQIAPRTPVLFLDTEMHFPETLQYQAQVSKTLGLKDVRIITPDREQVFIHDHDGLLHQADVDACCDLRKSQPLETALANFDTWITGRKRIHGGQRVQLPLFEKESDVPRIKVNPLAHWTSAEIRDYMKAHKLPVHPLVAQGYPSIGCMPCTARVSSFAQPRDGRWSGKTKTECGIHRSPAPASSEMSAQ